jgi:hypothetical protein
MAIGRNYYCLVRTGIEDFQVLTNIYIPVAWIVEHEANKYREIRYYK